MTTTRILTAIVAGLVLYTLAGIGYQLHLRTMAEARGVEMKARMDEAGGLFCPNREVTC